jgi:hypothetical protein
MSTHSAVDSSYDYLTAYETQCLKDSGVSLFIQCLLALPYSGPEQPRACIPNLYAAQARQLDIGGYIAIGSQLPGAAYVDMARERMPNDLWDALKFVAIDVEVQGIAEREVVEAVSTVAQLGQRAVIYTSHNIWTNYVTPSNSFLLSTLGVPLWNAFWDGDPDVDFSNLPFGGWMLKQVALEQWSGGTNVCGQFVDRNTIVHPELIGLGDDHMPTEEYDELKQLLAERIEQDERVHDFYNKMLIDIISGAAEVPIWPVGPVPLSTIRHKGYHSAAAIVKLYEAVREAQRALHEHITMHNQTGGAIDRQSGTFIDQMAAILDEIQEEVNNLGATI